MSVLYFTLKDHHLNESSKRRNLCKADEIKRDEKTRLQKERLINLGNPLEQ